MIDIRAQMLTMLQEAAGTAPVFDQYPEGDAAFPCVSFFESGNEIYKMAGGKEYLSLVTYTVDIWGYDWDEIDPILHAINEKMQALGFTRDQCADAPQPGMRHKTLRYSGVIDQDGMVYQK